MNAQYQFKRIKIVGISKDVDTCECCGRTNLTKTVMLVDLDAPQGANNDNVMYFGTTCAVNADKYDNLEAMKQAKRDVAKAVDTAKQREIEEARRAVTIQVLRENLPAWMEFKGCVGVTFEELFDRICLKFSKGFGSYLKPEKCIFDSWVIEWSYKELTATLPMNSYKSGDDATTLKAFKSRIETV